ncbi:MAG: hypothetical protein OK457_07415 [Thaumarchaeota archaeon]|nr:hypothetical protein [Nitrososphaerota archaeon]
MQQTVVLFGKVTTIVPLPLQSAEFDELRFYENALYIAGKEVNARINNVRQMVHNAAVRDLVGGCKIFPTMYLVLGAIES